MKLSIIRSENQVYVDGMCLEIPIAALIPADIHAVQWNGTRGHIEYADPAEPNMPLDDITLYQPIVEAWHQRKAALDTPPPPPTLADVKASAKRAIDAAAETCRLKYITPGAGMAMTYQEKFAQAEAVDAMGDVAANALTAEERIAQFPVLSASVGIEAQTLWDCAQLVLARYAAWALLANQIEALRLAGKAAIDAAGDVEAARAASVITWP